MGAEQSSELKVSESTDALFVSVQKDFYFKHFILENA